MHACMHADSRTSRRDNRYRSTLQYRFPEKRTKMDGIVKKRSIQNALGKSNIPILSPVFRRGLSAFRHRSLFLVLFLAILPPALPASFDVFSPDVATLRSLARFFFFFSCSCPGWTSPASSSTTPPPTTTVATVPLLSWDELAEEKLSLKLLPGLRIQKNTFAVTIPTAPGSPVSLPVARNALLQHGQQEAHHHATKHRPDRDAGKEKNLPFWSLSSLPSHVTSSVYDQTSTCIDA